MMSLNLVVLLMSISSVLGMPILKRINQTIDGTLPEWQTACVRDFMLDLFLHKLIRGFLGGGWWRRQMQ